MQCQYHQLVTFWFHIVMFNVSITFHIRFAYAIQEIIYHVYILPPPTTLNNFEDIFPFKNKFYPLWSETVKTETTPGTKMTDGSSFLM